MPVVDGPLIIGGNGITRIIFPRPGPVTDPEDNEKENKNTHATSYGVVYANDIAREDVAAKSSKLFRPGAIIVREKLSRPDSKTPDLLAAMVKREKGFNPYANDWEFLILNGTATKIRHREKTGDCLQCHASQRGKDFVFSDHERR